MTRRPKWRKQHGYTGWATEHDGVIAVVIRLESGRYAVGLTSYEPFRVLVRWERDSAAAQRDWPRRCDAKRFAEMRLSERLAELRREDEAEAAAMFAQIIQGLEP